VSVHLPDLVHGLRQEVSDREHQVVTARMRFDRIRSSALGRVAADLPSEE
jgi:hypothetical protein